MDVNDVTHRRGGVLVVTCVFCVTRGGSKMANTFCDVISSLHDRSTSQVPSGGTCGTVVSVFCQITWIINLT